jgi:hypothetical protein
MEIRPFNGRSFLAKSLTGDQMWPGLKEIPGTNLRTAIGGIPWRWGEEG